MATDLGKAYVQIMPSAQGISGSISKLLDGEASSAGKSAGLKIGSGIASVIGGAIAAAGIGKVISSSLMGGADLQQSIGGIETLFKGSADTVKRYAENAYKTSGLSANSYMENVTSFSASLISSLGGDTAAAAELANTALVDMSDNANKMGSDMESITQTYQSLARGNYAMLDNLKLGYGGTKSEMERLMADAEKLTGEHYTVGDFADTVKAIHAVQQHMDITGTTAKEAATTFSGSLSMMKSSFQNVLGALSSNEIDIGPQLQGLAESTSTFFFGNFIPMVGNIITNLPSALGTFFSAAASQMGPQIQALFSSLGTGIDLTPLTLKFQQFLTNLEPVKEGLQTAFGQLPSLFQTIADSVTPVIDTIMNGIARLDFSGFQSLISAIIPALQAGFQTFMAIVGPAIDNVVNSFVNLWNACQPLITTLSGALMPVFEILASFLGGIVKGALDGLSFAFDALKVAVEFLTPVIDFLVQALNFVSPVLQVIAQWVGQAIGMFGNLGTAGQGLSAFIKSAWTNIQSAIQTAGNIIRTVIDWIKLAFSGAGNAAGVLKNVFSLAWMGIQDAINVAKGIINGAISGIKSAFSSFSSLVSSVGGSVKGVISNITGVIKGLANIDISGAGAAIMNGFLNGLKSAWGAVTDFVGGIADWIAQNKGPISYDKVLLKPAGRTIMGGFNSSLIDGFKEVKSTVGGMAGELATVFDGQSFTSDFAANQSVDVSKTISFASGSLGQLDGQLDGQSKTSLIDRLANLERLMTMLVDKELAVYLDGEKIAQDSYMRQADIMAREGI